METTIDHSESADSEKSAVVIFNVTEENGKLSAVSALEGVLKLGEELTVVVNNAPDDIECEYVWFSGEKILANTDNTLLLTENYLENFIEINIKSKNYNGSFSKKIFFSKMPVIYITTDSEISGRDYYTDGKMKINGEYDGDIEIRWRGNSSLMFEKKPYKIKLAEKTDLFDMGSNKHWILLACMFDRSLMRDKLGLDFSGKLLEYYTESMFVEVVMNGKFIGTFQLCEQIRVGKQRVNIVDIEEADVPIEQYTSANGYDITGGYLLEISVQYDEISKFLTTNGVHIMVKSPEYAKDNSEIMDYLKTYLNEFENCIGNKDLFSDDGKHYSEWFDMESLVNYWVISQVVKTHDFMVNSTFLYKDAGEKFKMGPIWDLGNSLGNYTAANGWTYPIRYDDWSFSSDSMYHWYKEICRDPYFMKLARDTFYEIVDEVNEMTRDGGLIDQYYEQLKESIAANQALYPTFGNDTHGLTGIDNIEQELAWLKEFLTKRIDFMTDEFSDIKNMSLKYCTKTSDSIDISLIGDDTVKITTSNNSAQQAALYIDDTKIGVYDLIEGETLVSDIKELADSNVVIVRIIDSLGRFSHENYLILN